MIMGVRDDGEQMMSEKMNRIFYDLQYYHFRVGNDIYTTYVST